MDIGQIVKYATLYAFALIQDQLDLVEFFNKHNVEYVVIGGTVLELLGLTKSSGDIDIAVNPTIENSAKIYRALADFGVPVRAWGVTPTTFANSPDKPAENLRITNTVDIIAKINEIKVPFNELYSSREVVRGVNVPSIQMMIRLKSDGNRPVDIKDLALLKKLLNQKAA
jgi:hypothetical protein